MARPFKEEMHAWPKGAVTADNTATKVPKDAASRARNVAWLKQGYPAKRKGLSIVTASAQAGRNPILALNNGIGLNWAIDSAGRWSKVVNGAFQPIESAQPDGSITNTATGTTSVGTTLTPQKVGSWFMHFSRNSLGTMSSVTNGTIRQNETVDGVATWADSNGPVSGATTLTSNSASSTNWGAIGLTIYSKPGSGIGFDTSVSGGSCSACSTVSHNFTTGSTPNALFVAVVGDATSDLVTGVTANGVAMTLITKFNPGNSLGWMYIFELDNPPQSSTFSIVVTASSNCSKLGFEAASYSGVGTANVFTPGTFYPSTTIAHGLIFAANGHDALKTDGVRVSAWGFNAPAAPTAVDSGIAGNPNGTYLFALTGYNENTGHESSLSASVSVSVVSKKITVSWTFPSDPQITKVRVHVFKNGLSTQFFRVDGTNVTPAPDATTGGYSSSTTSITYNQLDSDINNLIIKSPSTKENNPPPAGITHCWFHGSRMFVTDGKFLYFSKLDDPESFDGSNEPVNTNDGQSIVAFETLADQHLLIHKSLSCYVLEGPDDPNTWEVREVDITVGTTSKRAISLTEGAIWWEAPQGLFRLVYSEAGVGKPVRMDAPNISDHLENVNEAAVGITCTAYDSIHQRLFYAIPDANQTRNTIILPFNTKINVWEDVWDPMDISAMGTFLDGTSVPYVAVGGYQGRIFRMWDLPYVDGVRITDGAGNPFTLTGHPTSGGAASLTDSGATFDTANDGLRDITCFIVAPNGIVQRNIILSNTGTVLTMLNNWIVAPDSTFTYYIGSPDFEFDTAHLTPTSTPDVVGSEFNSRKFKRVLVRGATDTGQSNLEVYTIIDGDFSQFPIHVTIPISSGGAKFDIDQWDLAKFGTGAITTVHKTLGTSGKSCGIRIRNTNPGDGVILLSVGLYGTEHSYKK